MVTRPAIKRGEVWLVELEPIPSATGREQAGRRPALVLSIDDLTKLELVTVLPITSKPRPFPSRVPMAAKEGGLPLPSFIIGEQVRTISVKRLVAWGGPVSPATMRRVEDVVRLLLGL
jgi:mRNA interferase MazF